ncbi:MAG: 2-oxoacid:acceptor oxidoreductase family protein, partial [Actinomycetota bacterium]|nr:2-oxoacid:acceptor oxidoreductase family protein [Actinomycetota bacterium]
RMATAIAKPGFALLDIWDLCTAYYVRSNKFTRANMVDSMHSVGMDEGLLYERTVPEYATAYREIHASDRGIPVAGPRPIAADHGHHLDEPLQLVVAGSAGGRIRSAARIVAQAAIRSGLWVTQRDDFPITVKAGHSVSQVVISPEEMPLTTITEPDVLVILSSDGFAKSGPYLDRMSPDGMVFTIPDYRDVVTAAKVEVIDPKAAPKRIPKTSLGLVFLAAAIERLQPFPATVLRETAAAGRFAEVNLESIDTGIALLD